MKIYKAPYMKVVEMTTKEDQMISSSFKDDWADAKEFKNDDDMWTEETTVTTEGSKNLWDKEW
ncbi:MAG: hypothetical protein ILA39_06230 [Bacteroidaceae bacterium]|nr:hypothetical protein [Bacteroidaceae bacterium]MBP1531705.1 hypothetical protein [Bacteroidaceae bacterium]